MGCLGAPFAAAEFEVGSQDDALFVFEDVFAAGHVWGMYWAGGMIKRTGGRGSEVFIVDICVCNISNGRKTSTVRLF